MKYYLSILMLFSLILIGCSSDKKTIYYWGDYQDSLYKTLKATNTSPSEQIITLEKIATTASAKNQSVPPGLYANLGLLYVQEGKFPEAKANFDKEKALYPESASYMTFLTDNMEGKRK